MRMTELLEIIEEEIYKALAEKTIASREPPRKMTSSQIARRDKIGNAMKKRKATVDRLKKKHGNEWESHLWATATNLAIDGGE